MILTAEMGRTCWVQPLSRTAQMWESDKHPTWVARARGLFGGCRALWGIGAWTAVGRDLGREKGRAVHYNCAGGRYRLDRNRLCGLRGLEAVGTAQRRRCLGVESWHGHLEGHRRYLESCCRDYLTLGRNRRRGSRCVDRPEPWTG